MSLHNARSFVARMREDRDFRNKALAASTTEELCAFLQSKEMLFNLRELVSAMAECMEQLELQTGIGR